MKGKNKTGRERGQGERLNMKVPPRLRKRAARVAEMLILVVKCLLLNLCFVLLLKITLFVAFSVIMLLGL